MAFWVANQTVRGKNYDDWLDVLCLNGMQPETRQLNIIPAWRQGENGCRVYRVYGGI